MVKKSKQRSKDALKQVLIPQLPTVGPGLGAGTAPGLLPEPPNWLTPWELQPQLDTAGGYDQPDHFTPGIIHTPGHTPDEEEEPKPPWQIFDLPDPTPDPDEDPLKPPWLIPTTGPPPPPGPSPPGLPDILELPHPPGGYPEPFDTPPPPRTGVIRDQFSYPEEPTCEEMQFYTGLPCGIHGEIQIRGSLSSATNDASRSTYRKKSQWYHARKAGTTQPGIHTRRFRIGLRQRSGNSVSRNTIYRRRRGRVGRSWRNSRRTSLF